MKKRKHREFIADAYRGEDILFIGPGKSSSFIDIKKAFRNIKYSATINDSFMHYLSDFWFSGIGLKMMQLYLKHNKSFFCNPNSIKVFTAHESDKPHPTFISKTQVFALIQSLDLKNCHCITRFPGKYLDNIRNIDLNFYQEMYNKVPLHHYLPSVPTGSLFSSLQTLFKLGFSRVFLLGFLDNKEFRHKDSPVSYIKEEVYGQYIPHQRIYEEVDLVNEIYKKNNRQIINLCPKTNSIYHGFEYFSF